MNSSWEPAATNPRSGLNYTLCLWAMMVVLVVYPLSIGPVWRLAEKFDGGWKFLEVAYAPLGKIINQSDRAARIFKWYVFDLWGADEPFFPK